MSSRSVRAGLGWPCGHRPRGRQQPSCSGKPESGNSSTSTWLDLQPEKTRKKAAIGDTGKEHILSIHGGWDALEFAGNHLAAISGPQSSPDRGIDSASDEPYGSIQEGGVDTIRVQTSCGKNACTSIG